MQGLTISKAAGMAGVGVETIRFYERKGLIAQPRRPANAGFRSYPQETIERIRFIRQAQELGFSLREVRALLELRANPGTDAVAVRARAQAKLDDVKEKIRQLRRIQDSLETLIAACPGHGALGRCSIMDALERHDTAADGRSRVRTQGRRRA